MKQQTPITAQKHPVHANPDKNNAPRIPAHLIRKALYGAAVRGDIEEAREVLDTNVDIDAEVDEDYGNPLQVASVYGHIAVVRLLLEKGADVNVQGGQWGSALQAASYWGHQAVVRLLLENGADVNAQGGDFGNALNAASAEGHEAVVRLLL
jgi:ankyrin repeat protein